MLRKMKSGETSQSIPIFVKDTTSTTGAGLGSLVYNSSGLAAKYRRQGQSSWTSITLATMTAGTWASGGFVADGGPINGTYEFGIPDAAITSGVEWVEIVIYGAVNMLPVLIFIELDNLDYRTSLPSNFSSLSIDGSGRIDIGKTLGQAITLDANNVINVSTKYVDSSVVATASLDPTTIASIATSVWTDLTSSSDFNTVSSVGKLIKDNIDVSISSRMATFTLPTNFSSLSISGSGLVDITQTAADKVWGTGTRILTAGTNIVLAKGTGITGFNDIAATAIVSGGAITTSGGAVSTVATVTNGVTVSTNNDKTGYSLTQTFPSNFSALSITAGGLVDITQGAADKAWSTASRTLTATTNLTGMSVNVASYSAGQAPLQPTISGRTLNVSASGLGDSDVKALNGDTTAAIVQSSANKVIYKGSVTSTTGPTSITDSALPNVTNNNWKGRVIVFLTGSLQYQATDITTNTGTTLNFTALTGTPSVSDEYLIF